MNVGSGGCLEIIKPVLECFFFTWTLFVEITKLLFYLCDCQDLFNLFI